MRSLSNKAIRSIAGAKIALFVVFVCLASAVSPAWSLEPTRQLSQYVHRVYETEQGLPQCSVFALTQTTDGFLWAATQEGVARFDGLTFTSFAKHNTANFTENFILDVASDRNGGLWAATFGGGLVHLLDGQATRYTTEHGLSDNRVRALHLDQSGNLWIGTLSGLDLLSTSDLINAPRIRQMARFQVFAIAEDTNGDIWVGSYVGLWHIRNDKPPLLVGFKNKVVLEVLISRSGTIWIGTREHGVARIENSKIEQLQTDIALPSLQINALLEDRHGNLWIGTRRGLCRYNSGKLALLPKGHKLSLNDVSTLFEDQENNLWIGTHNNGLHCLKDGKLATIGLDEGLPNAYPLALFEDTQGALWIGTRGDGLIRYDRNGFKKYSTTDGLLHGVVKAIAQDHRGDLWLGTIRGLNKLSAGRFSALTTANGLSSNFVSALLVDSKGTLWVGTHDGLNQIVDGQPTPLKLADGPEKTTVLALHEDRLGALWIGTDGRGIFRYQQGKLTHYTQKDGLSNEVIWYIHEDSQGVLWFGSYAGGLNRYKDGRFAAARRLDGLFDDLTLHVLEDNLGDFWMGCNRGIVRVSKAAINDFLDGRAPSVQYELFGKEDGMRSPECTGGNMHSDIKRRDGTLWFATVKGLTTVDPEQIKLNTVPPGVKLLTLLVNGRVMDLTDNNSIPPGNHRLEFRYTATSFSNPAKVTFQYWLHGQDTNWIDAGTNRSALYTNLAPKEYSFQVKACNNDGIWNKAGTSLRFVVQPFFYQTWWFVVICVVIVIVLAIVATELRVIQLRRHQEKLSNLVRERTSEYYEEKRRSEQKAHELADLNRELVLLNQLKSEFFGIAAHDLKNPLQVIMASAQLLVYKLDPASELYKYAQKILGGSGQMRSLINELLNQAILENAKMKLKKEMVNLNDLVTQVVNSHETFLEKKKQRITLSSTGPVTVLSDRGKIRRCLENLLSNAIKFSPRGTSIEVSVATVDKYARISVSDEGPGISDADRPRLFGKFQKLSAQPTDGESSTGLGLAIVKQLVDLHEGKILVENSTRGCVFIIELPKSSDSASSNESQHKHKKVCPN